MTPCPSPEAIAEAMADPDAASADILEHLAGCPRCRSLLDGPETHLNWTLLASPEVDQQDQPKAWFLNRLKTAVRYTVTAPPGLENGPSVAGYEVETEIARGGMGVVYRARDIALGRLVAIKVLRSDLLTNPKQHTRFFGEAKALASLQHPNVVQLFQAGEAAGQPYLVMEYVAGGTLRHAMRSGPWEPMAAAQLVRSLAEAVAAVHQIGVIHRDLKPGNVLLSNALRTPHSALQPKVADFGLARFLDSAERPTQTGEVFGTPEFMAPEQARGDQHAIGPETDVWALGVILYELLSGRAPFSGETSYDTLELVKLTPALPLELVRPGIPPDIAAVCMKCLQKLPYRRYRTAAALRDDLDSFLAGRPVSALPRSWIGRLTLAIQRHPWVAVQWSSVAVVLLGLLSVIGWQWSRAHSASTRSTAEVAKLREQRESTLRELYAARITLAARAVSENRLADAEQSLTACVPVAGDPDVRGWEWYYLSNRLRGPARIDLKLADTDRHGFDDVKLVPNKETFTADQSRRVVIDPAGRLAVYDHEGRMLLQLPAVPGRIIGVRFSKDGRWLAARTEEDAVIVFDGAPQ